MNKNLKVAEDYVNNGMAVDAHSSFGEKIKELFERIKPRKIIETGTYLGTGTTTIIAEALRQIGIRDSVFCTIEVNPEYYAKAKKYFEQNHIEVFALNGLSVPRSMLPTREDIERMTITDVQYGDIFVDHREQNRAEFYQRETDFQNVPDNLLYKSLEVFNFKPDFVLLDSAGHMGSIEFDYLIKNLEGECYIALDYIFHIKHHSDFRKMQSDARFEIIVQSDDKFGFCIARFDPAGAKSRCLDRKTNVDEAGMSKVLLTSDDRETADIAVNFFTIVLNGEPFIRYHIDVFKELPFKWHWHIVEGVAELKYDTAWSVKTGGRISGELHHNGRSNDGTTEYLDELARQYPENITVYRKSENAFWDGKLEMVNAPLANIRQECLLWQVDSDELWTTEQIKKMRSLFLQHSDKTAAYFHCDYFLGPKKHVSSLNTWATYPKDWLRVWRFNTGMRWASHEPPILVDSQNQNIGDKAPFTRDETRCYGITFQHFAYVTESQVRFKEVYYGYKDAVEHWKRLQQTSGPVNPADYLPWAKNDATVDDWPASKGVLLGERLLKMQKSPRAKHVKVAGEYHASENLMKVATESEFAKAVKELFARIQPRKIIETGTYLGTGTTAVIASALQLLGITDATFYTIEVNAEHYRQAIANLAKKNYNVRALNGLSVPRSILPTLEEIEDSCVKNIEFDDIFIDHKEHERALLYYKETNFENLPDDLLGNCLRRFDYSPDFVLLDSAGHMGFVEFKYLLENLKGACYIALDDTNHVKHYKSVQYIKQDPRFEIVTSSKEKFGFCIARFVPAPQIVREDVNRTLWSPANPVGDIVRDSKAVKNVLIVRPDAIGDFVIFSNILPSFRTLHPEAKISILLQDTVSQLAQNCPYVDEVITFKESQIRDVQYRSEVLAQLQSRHFDIAYYPVYSRSEIGDLLTLQSGTAKKIAFNGDNSNLSLQLKNNNDKYYDMLIPATSGLLVETDRNRDFMKGLGVDIPASQGTTLWLNQKDDDYVVELLKGLNINNPVIVSPFARFGIKDWPIEKWAQLLSQYPDENILICGGQEDYERAQKLISLSAHRHIYNLCGETTLSQTAAIMGHCKMYIGVDTGPAHMAAAANIPNVVLMGGGHLGRFMPYSPSTTMVYCHVSCVSCNWRCKFGTKPAPCLSQISVPTVIRAINAAVSLPVSRRKEPLVIAEPLQAQTSQIAENSSLDIKPAKSAVSYELVRENINKVTGFLVQDDERFLFEVAKSLPDDATIVEIGSFKGRSACCLAYACLGTRKKVYSIDLCFANASDYAEWKGNVGRNGLLDYVTTIAGDSKKIAAQWDKSIDFIFIDGSHSYLPVLSDFIGFYPWVKDHGVIAFHDVGPGFTGPMRVVQENAKPLLYDTGLCGGIAFGRKIPANSSLNKTKPAGQVSIEKYHARDHSLPNRRPLQIVEFSPQAKTHPVPFADAKTHKVLIVHTGSAGDVMLFISMLHVYRKKYSNSHIAICVEENVADIVLSCPDIDEVITFNADAVQKDTGYLNRLASQISSRKFDVAFHPVYSRTKAGDFITLASGAKEKFGFDNKEGEIPSAMRNANNPLYTKLVSVYEPGLLESSKYGFFTQSLNISRDESLVTPMWVTSEDVSSVENILRTIGVNSPIVIHPFSNDVTAQWPVHNWTKLISHYKDYPIIITGRKEDREKGDALIRNLQQQNIYNMCGQMTLRQSAILLHRARLCVTVESDESHLACAVDCPNIVVSGGAQFGRYLPYNKITTLVYVPMKCSNCKGACSYPECFCITRLKVETVRKAIDECLNGFPKDHLPLLPQIDSASVVPYKSVRYHIEEVEPVRDMYRCGLRLMQSNDVTGARSALEMAVNRLRPYMAMGVQWKTAGEGEHYYDTVKCYINACATLAQCYMQSGELGKVKALYLHLLENPVFEFSCEQISVSRTVLAKLQKVEPDNSMFTVTPAVTSQIVASPVSRLTEAAREYLVSAIVSTYNSEKYIRGCLEDLESQTIADKLEIIVIDSGSQQNEAAIVKEFQQRYNNIKYIRTERETVYAAWNRAVKAASGRYITNANTDDRHYKDALEKIAMALEQNPTRVIAYGNQHVTSTIDGEIISHERSTKQGGHAELLRGLCLPDHQPMWRRDLHDAVGYFDEQFFCSGDYEFWIRATQRFEMLYVDIFTGKKLMDDTVISLANKHLQTLENRIIAQSYTYAMRTREHLGKQGISGDARMANWPEVKVWKRLVAAKLSGRKWQSSEEIVDIKDMRTGQKPKLSVIAIETETTKWQCLQSLAGQNNQDFELILIAYRSIPSQSDLALFTGRICLVQLKDDIGAAFARNVGLANAKGDFVAYLNSNMKADSGWVEAIFRQFTNPKTMALRGQIIDNSDSSQKVEVERYPTICKSADNCAFRKNVLLEVKGFDEELVSLEGLELTFRICRAANNALDVTMFEPEMLVRLDDSISESQRIMQEIRNEHMFISIWRRENDIMGYIEFYNSQDPSTCEEYDNNYVKIIAIATFLRKNHPELALKWAEKAVALDPERVKGRYLLGSFYAELGRFDKAETLLESAFLTFSKGVNGLNKSGDNDRDQAEAECCLSAGTELAQCYLKKGRYGKLRELYTNLLNNPYLVMSQEQRAGIRALLVKLQDAKDVPVQASAPQMDSPALYPSKLEPRVNAADKENRKYLVSAIVSTYNSEAFFRGCLEDLENQTIADKLEIIVVNSGSEQNEESIIKEYQAKYNNIVYIKTEHEGLYSAWNRAIKVASGQFLTNANTDDRHRRDALEVMANALLENTDVALVYGNQIITDTPNPSFENHHVIEMAKRPEFSRERLLFGCCVGSQPMWRKSLHGEFGGFDETLTCAADWDFWLKIAQKHSFKHIDEFIGLFYRNENGIEHGRKIHSLYERYAVGKRYGNPYISVIQQYQTQGNPLISIIVTAYNAADYISRAIESILIQSYRNFEVIVIDDGSTDNTAEIVREFENEPIKYFFKNNGGVASARNLGLQKSGGQFVIMLDSDDMMTPDYIASHLQGFEQHPEADMVYCDDLLIDENDKPIRVINRPEYANSDGIISDMFRCGFPVVHFKTCIRRSVFDKLGLYDERLIIAEDYDMMRRFVKQQLKMHHLSAALYLRRLRADSLSKGFNAAKAKSHFDVIRRITETFTPEQLFPDVKWDVLPAGQKTMMTKCREALAYLGIGEQYINSKAPDFAKEAFDMACEQLDDCCKIEPANQQVRNLREKCLEIRAKHSPSGSRGAYQTV